MEIVVSDRLMVLCDMTHNHGLLGRDIAARLLSIVLIKYNAKKKAKSKNTIMAVFPRDQYNLQLVKVGNSRNTVKTLRIQCS